MQKTLFANPAFFVNDYTVQQRNLAGRPAKTKQADFQPDTERVPETNSRILFHPRKLMIAVMRGLFILRVFLRLQALLHRRLQVPLPQPFFLRRMP